VEIDRVQSGVAGWFASVQQNAGSAKRPSYASEFAQHNIDVTDLMLAWTSTVLKGLYTCQTANKGANNWAEDENNKEKFRVLTKQQFVEY
jgi:hypothetical protein